MRMGSPWMDMGSYFVRMKRTASRKLFQVLPALQDPYKIQKHMLLYDFGFGFDPQTVQKTSEVHERGRHGLVRAHTLSE